MNNHPLHVLPNGNVTLNNGNVILGKDIHYESKRSNSVASKVSNLPNGYVQLSNGNIILDKPKSIDSEPTSVTPKGDIIMSNGDIVAKHNVISLPSSYPNENNISTNFQEQNNLIDLDGHIEIISNELDNAIKKSSVSTTIPQHHSKQLNEEINRHLIITENELNKIINKIGHKNTDLHNVLEKVIHSKKKINTAIHPNISASITYDEIINLLPDLKHIASKYTQIDPHLSNSFYNLYYILEQSSKDKNFKNNSTHNSKLNKLRYSNPAPFHSENGQKYFHMMHAYGNPLEEY